MIYLKTESFEFKRTEWVYGNWEGETVTQAGEGGWKYTCLIEIVKSGYKAGTNPWDLSDALVTVLLINIKFVAKIDLCS